MQEVTERTSTASGMDELRKTVRTAAESKETVEPYDGCYEETDTRVGLKDGLNFVHVHSLVKHIHDYNRLSTKRPVASLHLPPLGIHRAELCSAGRHFSRSARH